ncbi:hypothetical protein HpDR66_13450 [Helicobacter pylori]
MPLDRTWYQEVLKATNALTTLWLQHQKKKETAIRIIVEKILIARNFN